MDPETWRGYTTEGRKKESLAFYHTGAWKKVRALALQRDGGMCQDCMDRLRDGYGIRPHRAQMVHHVIPISERPDLALELSNLRSLCNGCHAKEHPEKGWKRDGAEKATDGGVKLRVIKV